MAAYLGIDLGTTALKAIISDGRSRMIAGASVGLKIAHPKSKWPKSGWPKSGLSEQDPQDWWRALQSACRMLKPYLASVAGISFSGQMHSLVLLDQNSKVIRPAILWNDARAAAEAAELNRLHPDLASQAGVRAMASFFAPKLLWVQTHEPRHWEKTRLILAPKDYLRLCLTGEAATDPVDASGMWLCDVAKRDWSVTLLAACNTSRAQLPAIREATAVAGHLTKAAAKPLGLKAGIPVITGSGDAAASGIGLGLVNPGDGVISMGTSAQIIVTKEQHVPASQQNIHAYCYGLPNRWFQMAALLNGASPLAWLGQTLDRKNLSDLLKPVEKHMSQSSSVMFLPYLNGDRTPHDDPLAKGAFIGLDHTTGQTELARAVLEGVALSLSDCYQILAATGTVPDRLLMIGGGAKSLLWTRMIASALGRELLLTEVGEYGASLGAARLARLGVTGENIADICVFPRQIKRIKPVAAWQEGFAERLQDFRALYHALKQFRGGA
jgi:xylulokinase